MGYSIRKERICPISLAARTPPSQGGVAGSIPAWDTMIIKELHRKNYVYIEQVGYGNAFRYNSRVYLLCASSKDVPLKEDEYMFGMCAATGQIWKLPRLALVEELPAALIEYENWDIANNLLYDE